MGGEIYRGGKYMLLETMKEKYLEYVKVNLAKRTYDCYVSHLNFMFHYFEENKIINEFDLHKKVLCKFVSDSRERNNTNRTINLRIQILKNMFRENEIENDDVLHFKKLKEEKNTFGALSNRELNLILDYIQSDVLKEKNKLMLFILIDTGIRINELLNIKIENINFYNHTILLTNTKSHKPRSVIFSDFVGMMIKNYLLENECNDYLFEMTYDGVRSVFKRIEKKLNLNKFHPHMLRHTFASRLHKNGASVFEIKNLLGHSSVSITERYIHFDLDDLIDKFHKTNIY